MSSRYTQQQIEALTNWDGLLCKPPWRNAIEKRQYYSRFVSRYLWRTFSDEDWHHVAAIADDLRVPHKLKVATKFLANRHLK